MTISLVTCRAIGIGSYLVRLGKRVVQLDTSNIVLTGYSALNKVTLNFFNFFNFSMNGSQYLILKFYVIFL